MVYTRNLAVPLNAYVLMNIPDPRGNGDTLPAYNLQRPFLGLVNELDTTSPNNKRTYNGFDVTMNGRGRNGATLNGGVNVGHTISVLCDVGDPNALRFCDQRQFQIPWSTTIKISGTYPLPYGLRVSGVFQSAAGFGLTAPANTPPANPDNHDATINYQVNRTIIPALTQTQVNVLLDPPGFRYMPRVTQLDFSAVKTVRALGRLQRARRRRVGDEQPQNPVRRLREAAGVVQSCGVRRGGVGCAREIRGHEVHHHHEQASRRLRDVRLEGLRLQHRRAHALQEGCVEAARRGMPQTGPQAVLLLFAARLASPRLLSTRPHGTRRGPEGAGRMAPLHRLHEWAASRALDELRRDRRHLVRRPGGSSLCGVAP